MATSSPENGSDELAPETSVTDSGVSMPVDSTASNIVTDKMIEEEERYAGEVNNRVTASVSFNICSYMLGQEPFNRGCLNVHQYGIVHSNYRNAQRISYCKNQNQSLVQTLFDTITSCRVRYIRAGNACSTWSAI